VKEGIVNQTIRARSTRAIRNRSADIISKCNTSCIRYVHSPLFSLVISWLPCNFHPFTLSGKMSWSYNRLRD